MVKEGKNQTKIGFTKTMETFLRLPWLACGQEVFGSPFSTPFPAKGKRLSLMKERSPQSTLSFFSVLIAYVELPAE